MDGDKQYTKTCILGVRHVECENFGFRNADFGFKKQAHWALDSMCDN